MNITTPEFIANASTLNVDIYKHLAFIHKLISTSLDSLGLTLSPNSTHEVTVVLLQYIVERDYSYDQITDLVVDTLVNNQ